MAQQNTADDGRTNAQNDPELAAGTEAEAVDSLQVHMTRSEMRDAAREWGTRSSGTKQEMAEDMLGEAREQALGFLAEEGVALGADLLVDDDGDEQAADASADTQDSGLIAAGEVPGEVMDEVAREHGLGAGAVKGALQFQPPASAEDCTSEADEAALEARRRATPGYEVEDDEADTQEDDSSGRQRTTVGEMLRQHPDDYHRDSSLGFSEKQVDLLAWAMHHAGDTDEQVAEAQECSARYANSVCHRWPASDEGIEAIEDAGHEVPDCYQETDAPEGGD
jgi:Rod binding domain-containing protein